MISRSFFIAFTVVCLSATSRGATDLEKLEAEGRLFIMDIDRQSTIRHVNIQEAYWNHLINPSPATATKHTEVVLETVKHDKVVWKRTKTYLWKKFRDPRIRRMFDKYNRTGYTALPEEEFEQREKLLTALHKSFVEGKICSFNKSENCNLHYKEILQILRSSQDNLERKYITMEWLRTAGASAREKFEKYVSLTNKAANLNSFKDAVGMWFAEYETTNFDVLLSLVWSDLEPLYQEMHAYIRHKLLKQFDKEVTPKGPIPIHLLGMDPSFTQPYPSSNENLTESLIKLEYTPIKMFEIAEGFFRSLNFSAVPYTFWKNSVFHGYKTNINDCHPLAVDMVKKDDFRVRMCATVNFENYKTAHSKMAQIQYFMHYQHQPLIFRKGANPAFHKAVGETIGLSVESQKHLNRVGLTSTIENDEILLNRLYNLAYEKLLDLSLSYTLYRFHRGVFLGFASREDYNCYFWRLFEEIAGIEPSEDRNEMGFDPAGFSLFHRDTDFGRCFVSTILQFQFHIGLCKTAGEFVAKNPHKRLADCDIYQSVEAGEKLSEMMQLGSSKPWPEALSILTGDKFMKSEGILEFFKPLYNWLRIQNEQDNVKFGWLPSKKSNHVESFDTQRDYLS